MVRSKYNSDERIRSKYIDYDTFNKYEKALFERYDKFGFIGDDKERLEALLITVFNTTIEIITLLLL
ncbi:hypothetical protein B0O44_10854 [Pedobacter nutrimenti]|uniref:Uncharacterized protein n=1 Tax=Pedobacter nutrimenti TaxID=1241337 RepID=A0A318UMD5_9SPHI|nr:hypothetical protein B0O44_10854 [Pedobacter nutrimenti]